MVRVEDVLDRRDIPLLTLSMFGGVSVGVGVGAIVDQLRNAVELQEMEIVLWDLGSARVAVAINLLH